MNILYASVFFFNVSYWERQREEMQALTYRQGRRYRVTKPRSFLRFWVTWVNFHKQLHGSLCVCVGKYILSKSVHL